MVVLAKVKEEWGKNGKWVMLQPEEDEATLTHGGVLVGKTLINLQTGNVLVWMMNLSKLPQHIQKGTPLA